MTLRGVLLVALGTGIATLLLAPAEALAQDEWKAEEGEKPPPDDRPATPPPRQQEREREKEQDGAASTSMAPPTWLVELKIGPAFVVASRFGGSKGATEFGLTLNAGYALGRDLATAGDTLYLTVSPNLLTGSDLALIAPVGAQYDFPLKMIPYEGLYAYARASFGYVYYQPPFTKIDNGVHGFSAQPAIGARMTLAGRFHVGIEPIGFTILHTFPPKSTNQAEDTLVAFQIAILGGARF